MAKRTIAKLYFDHAFGHLLQFSAYFALMYFSAVFDAVLVSKIQF